MSNFPCSDSLSRGKLESKGHGNCRFTLLPTKKQLILFRIIVSANQLSLYGAVANMCEECESCHDRSGQLDKVMGQSIVLSEMTTEVPLENDDTQHIKTFYCSDMKSELKGFHKLIK